MTSLTTYLSNAVSASLGTASQLYSIAGTPSTTQVDTTIGTGTGYVELTKAGGSYTPVASLPSPSGNGWMLDPGTLDDQEILAGNWSGTLRLQAVQSGTPAGTLTSDTILRASKYSSGTYTTIVTTTLATQTINSTATAYNQPSTAGLLTGFDPGEKLYIDAFAHVTANGNANVNQGIRLTKLSTDTSGLTGDANASMVSPGFSALDTTTTAGALPMAASDLTTQYSRIMANVAAPQIRLLATTYYGNATNSQVIYGELDALLQYELISALHSMKSINDVTAFLQSIAYVGNVLNDAPIVHYKLNEASGATSIADVSGRKMNGTIVTGVTPGQAGALASCSDTSMLFSSGQINLPAGVRTDYWSAMSVSAWIYLPSATFAQTATIIGNSHTGVDQLGFRLTLTPNAAAVKLNVGNGSSNIGASGAALSGSTWYHIVGTYDGANIRVYINGSQSAIAALTGLIAPSSFNIGIGYNPSITGDYFPGRIQAVTLCNFALSAARVTAYYNAGIAP